MRSRGLVYCPAKTGRDPRKRTMSPATEKGKNIYSPCQFDCGGNSFQIPNVGGRRLLSPGLFD